jgi:hypothetical protein
MGCDCILPFEYSPKVYLILNSNSHHCLHGCMCASTGHVFLVSLNRVDLMQGLVLLQAHKMYTHDI